MISDDTHRKRMQDIITALASWAAQMSTEAHIEYGPADGGWRISARPHVETACPFEIIIRPDQQFDMMIGGQTYENLKLDACPDLPQIVRAIGEGRVLMRRWSSAATDLAYNVETVIDLPGGAKWRVERPDPDAPQIEDAELVSSPRSFVPYRR
jgi:hypothetical protein